VINKELASYFCPDTWISDVNNKFVWY